ncbi:MAG: Na+/melibiose symporter-like transporter [Hyphomicrobiaceae bacterium]|jgi:hypothetical protein
MPIPIKIVFSLVVLAVGVAGYYFLNWLGQGQGVSQYLALFLGVFAVISFWIFPEVVNKK